MPEKPRILIVDDDKGTRLSVRMIIEDLIKDCYIVEAENGAKALELLENETQGFDKVFSDFEMSDIDGIELLKEVIQKDIRWKIKKMIFMTGKTDVFRSRFERTYPSEPIFILDDIVTDSSEDYKLKSLTLFSTSKASGEENPAIQLVKSLGIEEIPNGEGIISIKNELDAKKVFDRVTSLETFAVGKPLNFKVIEASLGDLIGKKHAQGD